jgi:hypothetical protein
MIFGPKMSAYEFDLMKPNIITIAKIIRNIIPTIAINGFNGYNAKTIIPPSTMKIMLTTTPITAPTISLKFPPPASFVFVHIFTSRMLRRKLHLRKVQFELGDIQI